MRQILSLASLCCVLIQSKVITVQLPWLCTLGSLCIKKTSQAKLKQCYASSRFDLPTLNKNIKRILKCNVYVDATNLPDADHNKKPNQTGVI